VVVQSALEVDVDAIDLSFLSGENLTLTPNIAAKMSGSVNHYYERGRE
jgi:methylmalonyl-CoA mutase cobalamin-binding subunit